MEQQPNNKRKASAMDAPAGFAQIKPNVSPWTMVEGVDIKLSPLDIVSGEVFEPCHVSVDSKVLNRKYKRQKVAENLSKEDIVANIEASRKALEKLHEGSTAKSVINPFCVEEFRELLLNIKLMQTSISSMKSAILTTKYGTAAITSILKMLNDPILFNDSMGFWQLATPLGDHYVAKDGLIHGSYLKNIVPIRVEERTPTGQVAATTITTAVVPSDKK